MKKKIETRKKFGRICALVVVGMFVAMTLVTPVVGDTSDLWDRDIANGELYPENIDDEVGIGTMDPEALLHVDRSNPPLGPQTIVEVGRIGVTSFASNKAIAFGVYNGQGDPVIQAFDQTFGPNEYGVPLYINPKGGDVAIGKLEAPSAKLDIESTGTQLRLTHTDDPGTNAYIHTDFRTSDMGDLYINPYSYYYGDGNVGIGKTEYPRAKLDIESTYSQLRLSNADNPTEIYTEFSVGSGGDLNIRPSSKRVGINAPAPRATLDVRDTSDNAEIAKFEAFSGTQNQDNDIVTISGGGDSQNENDKYNLLNIKYGDLFSNTALVVRGDGNVGIGVSSPEGKLEVRQSGNADILTLYDYATIVFTVKDGGNVGIGTTNPSQALHVAGNARITGALYDSSNQPGTSGQILQTTGSGIDWVDPSSISDGDWIISGNNIYSAVSGNVGIGSSNPTCKLQVAGEIWSNGAICVGYTTGETSTFYNGITIRGEGNPGGGGWNDVATIDTNGNTYLKGKLHMGNNIKLDGNWLSGDGDDEGIYLANDGNVGIGTTIPSEKLEVDGNIKLTSGNKWIGLSSTQGVYIKSDGKVGIGTASPSEKLEVNGNIQLSDIGGGSGAIYFGTGPGRGVIKQNPGSSYNAMVISNVRDIYGDAEDGYVLYLNTGNDARIVWIGYTDTTGTSLVLGGDNYSTSYRLYVNGDAYATGKWVSYDMRLIPQPSAPSSPSEGDLYANSTNHHIYCYLNGAWKRLDN